MKKIVLLLTGVLFVLGTYANDPVKDLMSKYKGQKGFTTINISNGLLSLISLVDDDEEFDKLSKKIDGIRVIVSETGRADVNFPEDLKSFLEAGNYEELVNIVEEDETVRILVQIDGKQIKDMLILVNSDDEDVLVEMKGSFTFEDLGEMKGNVNIHGMNHIDKINLDL